MRIVAALLFLIATTQPVANQVPNRCASAAAAATADALATKFDDHQFIFIGSTHGDRKIEEFLMCLITRPAFQQRATHIVTEWASSGQQRLLDRYLLTLDDIKADDLGPEPDKDMTGSIPLTAAQQRELERRNSITSDPQRSMRARYQGRDQWFRTHPNDFPPRPN